MLAHSVQRCEVQGPVVEVQPIPQVSHRTRCASVRDGKITASFSHPALPRARRTYSKRAPIFSTYRGFWCPSRKFGTTHQKFVDTARRFAAFGDRPNDQRSD